MFLGLSKMLSIRYLVDWRCGKFTYKFARTAVVVSNIQIYELDQPPASWTRLSSHNNFFPFSQMKYLSYEQNKVRKTERD